MAIPFLQEANVDGIIRVLSATGTIRDVASADVIRNLHNGLTESEMDAIIGGLNLGGSGGKYISSPDDSFVLVDSDALPAPPKDHLNFFRVLRWQDDTVVDDPLHQMLEVYWPKTFDDTIDAVFGPDTGTLFNHGTDGTAFRSRLYLGADCTTTGASKALSRIEAGPTSCANNLAGLKLYSNASKLDYKVYGFHRFYYGNDHTQLTGDDPRFIQAPVAPVMVGGRGIFNGEPASWVGEFQPATFEGVGTLFPSEALVTTQTSKGWKIYDYSGDDQKWLNFSSYSTGHVFYAVVNGDEPGGDIRRDPDAHRHATLTAFGTDDESDAVAEFVGINTSYIGKVLSLRSYDTNSASHTYDFIQADRGGGGFSPVFRVTNQGNVQADGTYTSPANDVAEWITTDEQYEYGTVLVVAADGTFTKSTVAEDSKIAGVVAQKPGMEFGRGVTEEAPEGKRPMTVCGITPVSCTTIAGAIEAGDLLVASTNGMAQKAGGSPATGTVLGKALGVLDQPDVDPVLGEVSCLIILQ